MASSYDDIMGRAKKTLAQPSLIPGVTKKTLPMAKKLPAVAMAPAKPIAKKPLPKAPMSRSAAAMKERVDTEQAYGIGRKATGLFGKRGGYVGD